MNNSTSDRHYYDGYYNWDLVKWTSVIWQSLLVAVSPFLLYSVVWYERHSAELRYRTIINQLLSRLCLIDIFAATTAQSAYVAIMAFGPLEESSNETTFIFLIEKKLFLRKIAIAPFHFWTWAVKIMPFWFKF